MIAPTVLGDVAANGMFNILAQASPGWTFMGQMGIVLMLGLAAVGSAVGIGMAGQSAAGAWGKEGKSGKTLSFTYIILLGMPISQTLYAMIVMNKLASVECTLANAGLIFGIGLATGLGEMFSAWLQGLIGAAGIRSLSESEGKGFAFLLIAMGIVETVGIFAMVFMLGMIPKGA